jgi:hypothetical protein
MTQTSQKKPNYVWPEDREVARSLLPIYHKARADLIVNPTKNAADPQPPARTRLYSVCYDHLSYNPHVRKVLNTARTKFRNRGWAIYYRDVGPTSDEAMRYSIGDISARMFGSHVELNEQRYGLPSNIVQRDLINAVFQQAITANGQEDLWENPERLTWIYTPWKVYYDTISTALEHHITVEPSELMEAYDPDSVDYNDAVYDHLDRLAASELFRAARRHEQNLSTP